MGIDYDTVEDKEVSISSVAHAMLALESEIKALEREAEMHHTKMKLAYAKMDICRITISKLLAKTHDAMYASNPDTKTRVAA